MATYARAHLSGSTDGKPINLGNTATPSGNLVHTAVSGTSSFDEIYLWVVNTSGSAADFHLAIDDGSLGDADRFSKDLSIPANSAPIPILTGQVLNNAAVLEAWSDTASVLNVFGYINRIS